VYFQTDDESFINTVELIMNGFMFHHHDPILFSGMSVHGTPEGYVTSLMTISDTDHVDLLFYVWAGSI
jgi:hypothetical protein